MRAIVIRQPGDPDVLELRDVPTPDTPPDHVRVRVRTFGINRADLLQRRGQYPAPSESPEDIPGLEYAGEVVELGQHVTGFAVGERVMGIVGGGAYAEYVVMPATHAVPIPSKLSFAEAAALPEVFITAHDALERLAVCAGEWVLVHAVGSGVGTAALQLVKARGARSIGTSRTAAKLERARSLGLDVAIDSDNEDFVEVVRRTTESGADAAIDLVGGPLFPRTLEALALRGRLVLVGLTAGSHAHIDLAVLMRKRLRVEGTVLRSRSTAEKTAVVQSFREQVLPLFAQNALEVVVDRVFSFDEVPAAHRYMEQNANFGKIIVKCD